MDEDVLGVVTMRAAPRWLATDVSVPRADMPLSRDRGPRDATLAIGRVLGLCVVAVRGGAGLLGAAIAIVGLAAPATTGWVVPVVAVNIVWTVVFVVTSLRGLQTWVMSVDVVFVVLLCLGQAHYVSWAALPAGSSWVSNIASMCIVCGHLAWRPRVALPTGVIVTAAYLVGQMIAGSANGGVPETAVLTLQNVSAMGLMLLLRKVSRTADTELFEYDRAERAAGVRRVQRSQERETNRRLHDTVLATLTTVGSGAIRQSSTRLRAQARADLAVIATVTDSVAVISGQVRLDELLRQVVERSAVPLQVALTLVPCEVPDPVAESFAQAAAEALVNVGRHAAVDQARVSLLVDGHAVTVSVCDLGRGFDPDRVPIHRYGLREAIVGRMSEQGGTATITSAPGQGTCVTLWWSADG